MLSYFNDVREDNIIYSIDKVVLTGKFKSGHIIQLKDHVTVSGLEMYDPDLSYVPGATGEVVSVKRNVVEHFCQLFLDKLSLCTLPFDSYFNTSPKPGFYRHNFNFHCSDTDSFWVGVGLSIAGKQYPDSWKIEFNPNKCGHSVALAFVLSLLREYSSDFSLKDWDVAIDYPVLRENCFLVKDSRCYRLHMNSVSDKTEYLGSRHVQGYTKLYNKQRESKLNYPLTRLELTMEGICTVADIENSLPVVYCLKDLQMVFDDFYFNSVDRVLVWSVLREPSLLSDLPYKTHKKIECALEQHTLQLGTDKKSLLYIVKQAEQWRQMIVPQK